MEEFAPKARLAHGKDFRRPHVSVTERLRQAIEHGELSLHYQPQYALSDGRNCGVEALARWFLPNGESIPPATFIPRAEKHALIGALGAWVLHEACSTVASWRRVGQSLPILCVNVSPRQISREFGAVLATTLERTGFPPELLELEITEGILIERPQLALDCLAQWKRLGVRIALDDFGAGYSSLSYLSRLPVDRLKIDKSLIHRMTFDSKTAAIVRAIISLGADLGFDVLAEGVESESQLAMLSRMGCQQAQGYLLAMPECADDARALSAVSWGSRSIPNTFPKARRANESSHAS
jgi:EAL domain-containing protein (putative c-di-GMP-specific phosphodiesterase class I)